MESLQTKEELLECLKEYMKDKLPPIRPSGKDYRKKRKNKQCK